MPKTTFLDFDTTAAATLPAVLTFQLVDAAAEPVVLVDPNDSSRLLYRMEWAADGVDARQLVPTGSPGTLGTTLTAAEVVRLGGKPWSLWVARDGVPSRTWDRGLCRVTTVVADGTPEKTNDAGADEPQRIKVTLRELESGEVEVVGTTIYRGRRGKRGYPANMTEVGQMIAAWLDANPLAGGAGVPWSEGLVLTSAEAGLGPTVYVEQVTEKGPDGEPVTTQRIVVVVPDSGSSGGGDYTGGGGSFSLQIGTVTTVPAGQSATASVTLSGSAYVLNLGIPKGADGTSGGGSSPPSFGFESEAGTDGFAAGRSAKGQATHAVALGYFPRARAPRSTAVGPFAEARVHSSLAVGFNTGYGDRFQRFMLALGSLTYGYSANLSLRGAQSVSAPPLAQQVLSIPPASFLVGEGFLHTNRSAAYGGTAYDAAARFSFAVRRAGSGAPQLLWTVPLAWLGGIDGAYQLSMQLAYDAATDTHYLDFLGTNNTVQPGTTQEARTTTIALDVWERSSVPGGDR